VLNREVGARCQGMVDVSQLFGVGVAVLAAVALGPQLRVLRRGETAGFSPGTAGLALTTMVLWCVYTASVQDWFAFTASVLPGAAWAGTLVLLWRRGGIEVRVLARWAGVASATALGFGALGVVGTAAAAGSVLWMWPQLRTAVRSPALSGVSGASFALLGLEAGMWVGWGVVQREWVYLPASSLQVVALGLISVQVLRKR
jgi:uncharacterized protein with PQ loop repeat